MTILSLYDHSSLVQVEGEVDLLLFFRLVLHVPCPLRGRCTRPCTHPWPIKSLQRVLSVQDRRVSLSWQLSNKFRVHELPYMTCALTVH